MISISELLQKRKIQFHQANVEGVNLKEKSIRTSKGNLTYSELVIAIGTEPTFFNSKGAAENSFCVCSVESAETLKNQALKDRAQNLR